MKEKIFLILFHFLLPLTLILFLFWLNHCMTNKNKQNENFVDDILDSELISHRETNNLNSTFHDFHFHAAQNGFLRIDDFLLVWGSNEGGKNKNSGARRGNFSTTFYPNEPAGVIALPFLTGSGKYTLRIKKLRSTHFIVDDAQRCEYFYIFIAFGHIHPTSSRRLPWHKKNNGIRITTNDVDLYDRKNDNDNWENQDRFNFLKSDLNLYSDTPLFRTKHVIQNAPSCKGKSGPCCIM